MDQNGYFSPLFSDFFFFKCKSCNRETSLLTAQHFATFFYYFLLEKKLGVVQQAHTSIFCVKKRGKSYFTKKVSFGDNGQCTEKKVINMQKIATHTLFSQCGTGHAFNFREIKAKASSDQNIRSIKPLWLH